MSNMSNRTYEPKKPRFPPKHGFAKDCYGKLEDFVDNGAKGELVFDGLGLTCRTICHQLAHDFNLWHKTSGKKDARVIRVRKRCSPEELEAQRKAGKLTKTVSRTTVSAEELAVDECVAAETAPTNEHQSSEYRERRRYRRGRNPPPPFIPPPPDDDTQLEYYLTLKEFAEDAEKEQLEFPTTLTSFQRKQVHAMAEGFFMKSHSIGSRHDDTRQVIVEKLPVREALLTELREQQSRLLAILESRTKVFDADEQETPTTVNPFPSAASPLWESEQHSVSDHSNVRFMNWNIEWMDHFFQSDTEFKPSYPETEVLDTHALCDNIANVILEVSPDILTIEEGPSSVARMKLFVSKYLDEQYDVFGGEDGMEQRIFILIKKSGRVVEPEPFTEMDEELSKPWVFDVDGSFVLKEYKFTRRPSALRAKVEVDGKLKPLFIVSLHTKSKFIGSGKRMWNGNIAEKLIFIKKATKNRRRIAAECFCSARVRKALDELVWANDCDPLVIVSGDLNDGPGMDFFEEYYTLFDSVGSLLGNPFIGTRMLTPLLIRSKYVPLPEQWSVCFFDYVDERVKKVLLDHIFVSNKIEHLATGATVCHQLLAKHTKKLLGDTECKESLRQHRLSDHVPVFFDFL